MGQNAGWQVQIHLVDYLLGDEDLVFGIQLQLLGIGLDQGLSDLLPAGLGATVMLNFDVQVLAPFRTEHFLAAFVWTGVGPVHLAGRPPVVLLSLAFRTEQRRTICDDRLQLAALKGWAQHAIDNLLLVLLTLLFPQDEILLLALEHRFLELLLVLLHLDPVQELVRLHEHHWNERAVVKVHDGQDAPLHQVVLISDGVDIRHKVLVLEV